jgi:hypothetical protein
MGKPVSDVSVSAPRKGAQIERLLELETRMLESLRRGLDLTRSIASALLEIRTDELWADVSDSFYAYLGERTPFTRQSAERMMRAELICRTLEAANLDPPHNESQVLELSTLEEKRQPVVWRRVLQAAQENELAITAAMVRDAVALEEERAEKKAKGVQVDMDEEDELLLSEKGEEALARIKALCGKAIATAIRQKKNEKLTEDSVFKWAAQDDDTVQELARYVIDQGWTVRKALNYISQIIDDDTQVDELVLMARNRGGHFAAKHQSARIVVDIIS